MEGSPKADQYSERLNRIYQRLSNIQHDVGEEKHNRNKAIETLMVNFEKKIEELQKEKQQRYEQLLERVRSLQNALEEDITLRGRMESNLSVELKQLERNCQELIGNTGREGDDNNRKFANKIANKVDSIAEEIAIELEKYQGNPELQHHLEETLPNIKEQIQNEVSIRKEVEAKIYEQFMDQINELNQNFETERREREKRNDQFVKLLKSAADKLEKSILSSRNEREKNFELMLRLVEQVIEKLKRDVSDIISTD
mmetsp:Transcript_29808/g.34444  ORF Transcript_29808/g.34444 Transcript_29808/m.34444 type:complete len:256 (+) Transcript_29808:27-794(+)